MKYRSRTDIISNMLEVAANLDGSCGSITKTKIMRKSFISFDQLNEYLSYLLEKKLLDYDNKTAEYKITDTGLKFLKAIDELSIFTAGSKTDEIKLIA